MECSVCEDGYNLNTRKPTILPCGHTFCLACVKAVHQTAARAGRSIFPCPKCRAGTQGEPDDLPTNYTFLELLETVLSGDKSTNVSKKIVKNWCLDCKKVANFTCNEEHAVCRLKTERARQLKDTKQFFETIIKSQSALEKMLIEQVDEVKTSREGAQGALDLLNNSLEVTGAEWDRVCGAIKEARIRCLHGKATEELLLQWGPVERCELALHGQDGQTLNMDFNLANEPEGSALVLAMVTTLQRARLLNDPAGKKVKEGPTNQTSSSSEPLPKLEQLRDSSAVEEKSMPLPGNQELDLHMLSQDKGQQIEKAALLVPLDPPVTSVRGLWCTVDPYFAERLLRCHGPTLERLELLVPSAVHVDAATAMPRLRTLEINYNQGTLEKPHSDTPATNLLRLDALILLNMQDIEKVLALIAQCGGAQRIDIVWNPAWPVDRLAGLLKEQQRNRTAFTMPRAICLWCWATSNNACPANAARRVLPGVDVWCRRHDPNHEPLAGGGDESGNTCKNKA